MGHTQLYSIHCSAQYYGCIMCMYCLNYNVAVPGRNRIFRVGRNRVLSRNRRLGPSTTCCSNITERYRSLNATPSVIAIHHNYCNVSKNANALLLVITTRRTSPVSFQRFLRKLDGLRMSNREETRTVDNQVGFMIVITLGSVSVKLCWFVL